MYIVQCTFGQWPHQNINGMLDGWTVIGVQCTNRTCVNSIGNGVTESPSTHRRTHISTANNFYAFSLIFVKWKPKNVLMPPPRSPYPMGRQSFDWPRCTHVHGETRLLVPVYVSIYSNEWIWISSVQKYTHLCVWCHCRPFIPFFLLFPRSSTDMYVTVLYEWFIVTHASIGGRIIFIFASLNLFFRFVCTNGHEEHVTRPRVPCKIQSNRTTTKGLLHLLNK